MTMSSDPVAVAIDTVRGLFAKYGITSQAGASRLIRERFTQEDLDAYTAARDVLDGTGVLG